MNILLKKLINIVIGRNEHGPKNIAFLGNVFSVLKL